MSEYVSLSLHVGDPTVFNPVPPARRAHLVRSDDQATHAGLSLARVNVAGIRAQFLLKQLQITKHKGPSWKLYQQNEKKRKKRESTQSRFWFK